MQRQREAHDARQAASFQSSHWAQEAHGTGPGGLSAGRVSYTISFASPAVMSAGTTAEIDSRRSGEELETKTLLTQRASSDFCEPANHLPFLQEQVYVAQCVEDGVHVNSGVLEVLNKSAATGRCYCRQREVSFRNLALGDRGVSALLPLLTFGRTLKSLCLVGNGMREQSVRQLCAIIQDTYVLTSLMVLDLSHNPLGAACADELQRLAPRRRRLLLIGTHGTQIAAERRQRLLRLCLANVTAAEPAGAAEALALAKEEGFADLELLQRSELAAAASAPPPSPRAVASAPRSSRSEGQPPAA